MREKETASDPTDYDSTPRLSIEDNSLCLRLGSARRLTHDWLISHEIRLFTIYTRFFSLSPHFCSAFALALSILWTGSRKSGKAQQLWTPVRNRTIRIMSTNKVVFFCDKRRPILVRKYETTEERNIDWSYAMNIRLPINLLWITKGQKKRIIKRIGNKKILSVELTHESYTIARFVQTQ